MPTDIHEKPFDEATFTKLEIFERYLIEWLPVFIEQNYPRVYIVDFFAGPGKDKNGQPGSPLRIIDSIFRYKERIENKQIRLELIFNEFDIKKCEKLEQNVEAVKDKLFYNYKILNEDFKDIFYKLKPDLECNPSLLFIDQSGIRQVTGEILNELAKLQRADFLFFISSSFFIRFCDYSSFKKHFPDICQEELREKNYNSIHRKILEHYKKMLHPNSPLRLIPFSIKKSRHIYGLIFGTKHILGVDKFLSITWDKNQINGEANFDIDEDLPKKEQPSLFAEFKRKTKLDEFEENLRRFIVQKKIVTNKEIYDFTLDNGFIHTHAKEKIKKFIKEKKLKKMFEGRGLFIGYKQCYKERNIKKFEWID